jgi:hypothetical protein
MMAVERWKRREGIERGGVTGELSCGVNVGRVDKEGSRA